MTAFEEDEPDDEEEEDEADDDLVPDAFDFDGADEEEPDDEPVLAAFLPIESFSPGWISDGSPPTA